MLKSSSELLRRALEAMLEASEHPRGMQGVLEDQETKKGATLVKLGAKTPFHFSERDWVRGVISLKGREVRIVAIEAYEPGNGALKRLIASITSAGYQPVVVAAMLDMPKILKHWGWEMTREPDEWGNVDTWRPPNCRSSRTGN